MGRRWTVTLDGSALPERALVGGKAWGIAHMLSLGMPVPPAFVVTTEACRAYLGDGKLPAGLAEQLEAGIAGLEAATGRMFGGAPRPLLVSVRSGAAISMPGMMDTVLNLGMDETVEGALAQESDDAAFARDTHRRFCEMYARIVLKAAIDALPPEADIGTWRAIIARAGAGTLPSTPVEQLIGAVKAVFESWNGRRAKRYRKHHGIPDDAGTAVTIQAMVFGNLGAASGTGVVFSRNPLTGAAEPFGEYLARAQGEDVVSGTRTPAGLEALGGTHPAAYQALLEAARTLETARRDVQDIEYTVQEGALYLLQARAAKRSPTAALRIAVDLAHEGLITTDDALDRITAEHARAVLAPRLVDGADARATVLAHGEGASPGVGIGAVVLDADTAEARAAAGEDVVLVRPTTSPEDVHGMIASRAVVTATGGSTSHAAVVSRALGVPCVVGCGDAVGEALEDHHVTVEGQSGRVFEGAMPLRVPRATDDPVLRVIEQWARARAPLAVHTPDDAPADARLVDLDRETGGELVDNLPALLRGAHGAKGGALASDAGVAAAVEAGLRFIVVRQPLPALIAACAAGRARGTDAAA